MLEISFFSCRGRATIIPKEKMGRSAAHLLDFITSEPV
jgi:hypothetical protein